MTFSGLFFVLVFLPVFLIIYLLAKNGQGQKHSTAYFFNYILRERRSWVPGADNSFKLLWLVHRSPDLDGER